MNNVYRVIWNSALRCFMVASELASGKTKSSTGTAAGLLGTALLLSSFSAAAAPNGQLVINGTTETYDNYQIATAGTSQYAIHVINGGDLTYTNNQATTTGGSAYAALVQSGSTLNLDNVFLGTFGVNTHVLYAAGGSTITANNLQLLPLNSGSYGINLLENSQFTGTNVQIQSTATGILVADSTLDIDTVSIATSGANGYGIRYTGAANVDVKNATINTAGVGASGILAQAGGLVGSNVAITTAGDGARGIITQGVGTQLNIDTLGISTQGTGSYGIQVADTGAVTASNITINTAGASASGIRAQGGTTTLTNANISTTGADSRGILASGAGTAVTVDGGNISTAFGAAHGVQAMDNAAVNISNMNIDIIGDNRRVDWGGASALIASNGGYIKADSLNINTHGNALWLTGGKIDANNLNINQYSPDNGIAIWAQGTSELNLTNSQITLNSPASIAIMTDTGQTSLDNVSVKSEYGGYGVSTRWDGSTTAKNVDVAINNAEDADGAGISLIYGSGLTNATFEDSRVVVNGSKATGLMATGGEQTLALKNTLVSSEDAAVRVNADAALNLTVDSSSLSGKYLLTGGQLYDTGGIVDHINFIATNGSQLSGDVSIDRSYMNNSLLSLDASAWKGASDGLQTLNLNNGSQWTVTGDSNVGELNLNDSTVMFSHANDSFETLTVNGDYTSNGGTLMMNSVLADDGSAHDTLKVNGNTSGDTNVVMNKAGGNGAPTIQGIEVISVAGESAGEFNQQGRIVAGAYDYHLVRGTGSAAKNWYLISDTDMPVPVDPADPIDPVDPTDPSEPTLPVLPVDPVDVVMITRPEAGSYLANIAAANNMFTLRLHDRGGETQYTDAITGEKKVTSLWMRNVGGHNQSTDSSGQLKTQTNRYVVQIGGDLGKWRFSGNDSLHVGTMAGYGNAQSNTDSKITGHRSEGQVNGYSLGVYGTWYQNAATQTGAYFDTWAQYGWFNNSVKGDGLPQESYKSNGISASLEGGYSWKLGEDSAKNSYFVEPNAQFIWSNIQADDVTENNGTRVSSQGSGNVQSRVGVRASMKTHSEKQQPVFQPYLEANWISNSQNAGATMNGVNIEQRGSKNIAEMRAGVDGQLTQRVNLWGNVGQQMGSESYRDTSAMIGVKVSF